MKKAIISCIIFFTFQLNVYAQQSQIQESESIQQKSDSLLLTAFSDLDYASDLTGTAQYPEAYDKIWEVLAVADSLQSTKLKYASYRQLAMLYAIFSQKDKAADCLDSMFLYLEKTPLEKSKDDLIGLNHTASIIYRMNGDYNKAKNHLGRCLAMYDSMGAFTKDKVYILSEQAHIHTLEGEYDKAEFKLKQVSKSVKLDHSYLSILYSMWGDLYAAKGNIQKALASYNQSLAEIAKQNIHIGLKVELLRKVADINSSLGNYQLAFEQINASRKLGNELFGSRSTKNAQLFNIKDSYREALIEHQNIERNQAFQLLQSEKEKLTLRLTFAFILCFVLILSTVLIVVFIKRKHKIEKQLEKERSQAIIEVKKKELLVTALQLVEKDKMLNEIKSGLEESSKNEPSLRFLKNSIRTNSLKNWQEFETHFINVNEKFYDRIKEKHPNLTQNELKICALIKLNFSSKDMAHLIGISHDSINKSRYRLRKKINLSRDENLASYIGSF